MSRAEALSADVVVCDEYQHRQDTGEDLLPEGKLRVSLLRGYEVFSRRELLAHDRDIRLLGDMILEHLVKIKLINPIP